MHHFFQRVFAPKSEELSKYTGLFMSTDKPHKSSKTYLMVLESGNEIAPFYLQLEDESLFVFFFSSST